MRARLVSAAAAALAVLAVPSAVAANQNTVAASCAGLTFDMARGEAGTIVTVSLDGEPVIRTTSSATGTFTLPATVAAQFDPMSFTVASPDQTRPHTWVVVIDSVWNTDQRIVRTVEPCTAPTTVPQTTTTSSPPTTVPAPSSTTPTASTVVDTTTPATTVITTPRPGPSTSTVPSVSSVPLLPATGADPMTLSAIAGGAVAVGCIAAIAAATRRKGGAS